MRKSLLIGATLLLTAAAAADAQMRPQPRTWVAGFGLMYTNVARFHDPGTDSDWVFDDNAFGFGLGAQHEIAQGLQLGVETTFARPRYDRRRTGTNTPIANAAGTASVVTAMGTGRIAYGGVTELGFYLNGGIGTIAYHLEDVGAWNSDFALRAGTGVEYRFDRGRAVFLEWGRIWGYHEREGVGGGAAQHGVLKVGFRAGR